MAYTLDLSERVDDARFRASSNSSDESPFAFFRPTINTDPKHLSASNLTDTRASLHRRFTTQSLSTVSTISALGQQRRPPAELPAPESQSSIVRKTQLLERKQAEYDYLRQKHLQIQQDLDLMARQVQREEEEVQRLRHDLGTHHTGAGHQSEPTTPPEYRENGFPSALSRPNRFSSSSIISPMGIINRPSRAGSQVTSPPVERARAYQALTSGLPSQSVPGSRQDSEDDDNHYEPAIFAFNHRSAATRNRNSMPVTRRDLGVRSGIADFDTNLGPVDTSRFLFGDEYKNSSDESTTSSRPISNFLSMQQNGDNFPVLIRSDGENRQQLSSSSDALDLALSDMPGPNSDQSGWPASFTRPSTSGASFPVGAENSPPHALSHFSSPGQITPPKASASNRHSMGAKITFTEANPSSLNGMANSVSSSRMPSKLQTSFSTSSVPTVSSLNNNQTAVNATPISSMTAAEQRLHQHNASLGRIPASAINGNRQSREVLSGSDARAEVLAITTPTASSTLQANAAPFGPVTPMIQPTHTMAAGPVNSNTIHSMTPISANGNPTHSMATISSNGNLANNPIPISANGNTTVFPAQPYAVGYGMQPNMHQLTGAVHSLSITQPSGGQWNGTGYGQQNGVGYGQQNGVGFGQLNGVGFGQQNSTGFGQQNGTGYGQQNGPGFAQQVQGYGQYAGVAQPRAAADGQARAMPQQRRVQGSDDPTKFGNIAIENLRGELYNLCKDQHGCRYLQKKLEERNPDHVQMIFEETKGHVVELMTDPFGNYLCQKLLEYANDVQRTELIRNAAPHMVDIALNQHGTRALQKMIDFVSTQKQIEMVIAALNDHVVKLIQDLNGNHVIQKCLNRLTSADAQFIFDKVAEHCVAVGTHRHGCCVIQRCIDHASGVQRAELVAAITRHSLPLVQDPFGNYVIQYIFDQNEPAFSQPLCRTFLGNAGMLSRQKFSSNVIEKCLRVAVPGTVHDFIQELLSAPDFERLVDDPFANYVFQTAWDNGSPGDVAELGERIRPMLVRLKTKPYGRRFAAKIAEHDQAMGLGSDDGLEDEMVGNSMGMSFNQGNLGQSSSNMLGSNSNFVGLSNASYGHGNHAINNNFGVPRRFGNPAASHLGPFQSTSHSQFSGYGAGNQQPGTNFY